MKVQVEDTEDEVEASGNGNESTKSRWKRGSGFCSEEGKESVQDHGDKSTKVDLDNLKAKGRRIHCKRASAYTHLFPLILISLSDNFVYK